MLELIKATIILEREGYVETLELSCRDVQIEPIYEETKYDWPYNLPRRRIWNKLGERIDLLGITSDGIRGTSRVKEAE